LKESDPDKKKHSDIVAHLVIGGVSWSTVIENTNELIKQ
jgi:hypothetical protein